MRTLRLVGPLLVAALVFACSSELPTPAEAPELLQATQQAQVSSEQQRESQSASEPRLSSASRAQAQRSKRETTEPQDSEQQASPEPQSRDANQAESTSAATEAIGDEGEPEADSEEPQTELTVIPATVVLDAKVRVRPGLPWPVVDRLSTGDEVVVLNLSTGWYRINYGEDREGWIRTRALDLGAIESHRILDKPAPAIVAEWQGEEYGVMGQSADGTEVRLLDASDELGEIVGAPIDEVRLLAEDISVHDLPILIGDETVVFPGDDFRVGQGKILPKANEWMWLPWGWLLAHNDTHIWQWRPETDELEFIRRPPGFARFSPGGESLAILTCGGTESCHPYTDVMVLPLDGTPMVSLMDQTEISLRLGGLKAIDIISTDDFMWTGDRLGLLIPLVPESAVLASSAALMHVDRRMVIFDPWSSSFALPEDCRPAPSPRGYGWRLHSRDLVAFRVLCEDDSYETTAVYDPQGQTITVDEVTSFDQQVSVEGLSHAEDLDQLGDGAYELPGGTERHSIVVAPGSRQLFISDKAERELRPVADESKGTPDWFWDLVERGPEFGYQRWDLYWTTNRNLAIISRTDAHVAAGLLVNLATGKALPLQIGSIRTWPCFPTGAWSPDGTVFQIEFEAISSYERLEDLWIDGTAAPGRRIAQRQIVGSDGETLGVMRELAHLKFTGPVHIAEWSADGRWLAIGGHQELHHCYRGA